MSAVIYAESAAQGLSVIEREKTGEAAREITRFAVTIFTKAEREAA